MRRFHLGLLIAALPVMALSFIVLGCGPQKKGGEGVRTTPSNTGGTTGGGSGTPPATGKALVAASYDGTVKGKFVWKGVPAEADLKSRTAQYVATLTKSDRPNCHDLAPSFEQQQQEYRIEKDKVRNVFVWLEAPDRTSFIAVPEEKVKEYADGKKNVELKQPHCAFHPRAFVLFPSYKDKEGKTKPTGQKLEVENNAKIPHNTKCKGGRNEFDTGLMGPGTKDSKSPRVLQPTRDVVRFECNIHNWMRAYAWVFDHPYATVSKAEPGAADFGTFEIAGAPVGVPLKLVAWHEGEGYLKTSDQPITLKAGENTFDIDFVKKE
jgi:hypothetical protein